jgi:hypothetical protein
MELDRRGAELLFQVLTERLGDRHRQQRAVLQSAHVRVNLCRVAAESTHVDGEASDLVAGFLIKGARLD